MRDIRFKSTGNKWVDVAIGVVVLVLLCLILLAAVDVAQYVLSPDAL